MSGLWGPDGLLATLNETGREIKFPRRVCLRCRLPLLRTEHTYHGCITCRRKRAPKQ